MTQKPLEILKKGLIKFKEKIKLRRDNLLKKLSQNESISSADEQWLDNDANTVDEQRVLDTLEAASDYEKKLQQLDEGEKAIIQKLREWAGDIAGNAAGNKRKRSEYEKNPKESVKKNTKPADPVFTKKENAMLCQRIEVLDWYHKNGRNQTATARHFAPIYPNLRIKQPLVSSWIKEEPMWRDRWEKVSHQSQSTNKRAHQTEHPEISEMMDLWVEKAMGDGLILTGEVLRQKWIQFADLAQLPDDERLKLSNGWLARFKGRTGLHQVKRHGEAASAMPETVEKERERVQILIKESGYALRDIFNMDETGLFYGMAPDRGLSNSKRSGVKGTKVRLTYAFTSNADGSEKLKPFIIGKAARPRAFNKRSGTELGFYYRSNAKAWMTTQLYQEWLLEWDQTLTQERRKVLLLQDNFSGHIAPAGLNNIRIENFAPNLTAHVQPKDQGIIRCFKAHYRAHFIQRAVDRYDEGVTPSEIYDINQLHAMRLADIAWREVDTTTIRNCWRKAGILPDILVSEPTQPLVPISSLIHESSAEMDPVAHAERGVEQALDKLVSKGVLQMNNRMDVDSLLNPIGESHVLTETSDIEIYQAVMDAVDARENMIINGGDDVDEVICVEPQPSRRDVLKATSTISRYLDEWDDPIARKIEALLGTLNRKLHLDETRDRKETTITDYFTKS